jgi:hypothetical protein
VLDEVVAADKEATDKRAMEEATTKGAAEEAMAKAAATEEVAGKTVDEAARAAGGSLAPDQAPSAARAKRVAAPSGSTPPAKRPYRGVWKSWFVQLFLLLFSFFQWGFILLLHFLPRSSPFGVATAIGTTASVIGTAVADAAVGVTLGLTPDGQPRTPEGVPKDVVEDSEGEPEVASEPVLEVVREEAPAEGAMIAVCAAAVPLPSHGARAPLSSVPRRAAASGAATDDGMEVVLGHPIPYVPGDISVGEAMSTAHQALSQV